MESSLERRLNAAILHNNYVCIGYASKGFRMVDTVKLDSYEITSDGISLVSGKQMIIAHGDLIYDDETDEFIFVDDDCDFAITFLNF